VALLLQSREQLFGLVPCRADRTDKVFACGAQTGPAGIEPV